MEQKPHVPGYGKEQSRIHDLDREMTMEELEAMEVPSIEVIKKKGAVESKIESLKQVDVAGTQHRIKTEEMSMHLLQEKLARETIGGKTAQARATEAQIQHKKLEIAKMKSDMMHHGKAGRA